MKLCPLFFDLFEKAPDGVHIQPLRLMNTRRHRISGDCPACPSYFYYSVIALILL